MTRPDPVRVLFDSEIFAYQLHGGISRYFVELVSRLPLHGVEPRLIAPLTFNEYLHTGRTPGFVGWRAPARFRNHYTMRAARGLSRLSDRVAGRYARHDLFHHTYYGRGTLSDAPSVVTVVDMIPEVLPELFPRGNPHLSKREACARASLILTISEHTRQDLLRLWPDVACPVEVVHLAVDASVFASRATGEESNYLLFVGERGGYKDFATFAQAAASLLRTSPQLRVMCVGGQPLTAAELAPFVAQGVQDRVSQRRVSDEELPSVYRQALVFVFPSLYEGFGLPILEAFACRCPVIVSRASCFPEVAGDAAEYFEAGSPGSLLEVLERLTADPHRRDELRQAGTRRIEHFSWGRTAQQTAAAYRRVLGKG
jgi:glycosyltransferase involved in cell wall biosynthesis